MNTLPEEIKKKIEDFVTNAKKAWSFNHKATVMKCAEFDYFLAKEETPSALPEVKGEEDFLERSDPNREPDWHRKPEKTKLSTAISPIPDDVTNWDALIGFRDGKYFLADVLKHFDKPRAKKALLFLKYRQSVIDYIYDFAWHWGRFHHFGDKDKIIAAINDRLQLPEEFLSVTSFPASLPSKDVEEARADERSREWISVDEGLPGNFDKYGQSEKVLVFEDSVVNFGWIFKESKNWGVNGRSGRIKVTHWQPLPPTP